MPNFWLCKPPSANFTEEYQYAAFCFWHKGENSIALAFLEFLPYWETPLHWPAPQVTYGSEKLSTSERSWMKPRNRTGGCQSGEAVLSQSEGDPGSHRRFPACTIISSLWRSGWQPSAAREESWKDQLQKWLICKLYPDSAGSYSSITYQRPKQINKSSKSLFTAGTAVRKKLLSILILLEIFLFLYQLCCTEI